jgi:hypothetical protein
MTFFAHTYAEATEIADELYSEGVRCTIASTRTGYMVLEDSEEE